MGDNIEDKIRNIEEWNREREKVKPFIDKAIGCHNRAHGEARYKNYGEAAVFYREAIKHYKDTLELKPRFYLKDLLERIDRVVEEYINNMFNLKTTGDCLKTESGIRDFIDFIDNLNEEEKTYIDPYDVSHVYFHIADLYYEEKNLERAYEFYNKVIDTGCNRPFINRDSYFKMASILFEQQRFKEALVSFVAVLSFDRGNKEIVSYLEDCLKRLGIAARHKHKFLAATPREVTKLIMEVL